MHLLLSSWRTPIASLLTAVCFAVASPGACAQAPMQPQQLPTAFIHPWQGKRVAFIGDSITDPGFPLTHYWEYLRDWLQITPLVYAVSGHQWTHTPQHAQKLHEEHPDDVDAILILMGTNDFNSGTPIGRWYTESEVPVMAAQDGKPQQSVQRRQRTLNTDPATFKGRINAAMAQLKQLFPTQQIVLLTPLHRGYAYFGESNVQPDESYTNACGEYIDAYVQAVKEAGTVWAVPVIDLHALSGLNPMVEEQRRYFLNNDTDQLHPNSQGHQRMALTLMYQLLALPADMPHD